MEYHGHWESDPYFFDTPLEHHEFVMQALFAKADEAMAVQAAEVALHLAVNDKLWFNIDPPQYTPLAVAVEQVLIQHYRAESEAASLKSIQARLDRHEREERQAKLKQLHNKRYDADVDEEEPKLKLIESARELTESLVELAEHQPAPATHVPAPATHKSTSSHDSWGGGDSSSSHSSSHSHACGGSSSDGGAASGCD